MNLELHNFNNLAANEQQDVAERISAYTKGFLGEQPQMLPVEAEAVLGKHMGVVALFGQEFAGYIGATEPDTHNGAKMPEVGSLWVPEAFRNQGIAKKLVKVISADLLALDELPYAFCNPLSLPIFIKAGYEQAGTEEVPPVALTLCKVCPKRPPTGCCDTLLILKGNQS